MSNLTLEELKEIYQKNYEEKCSLYPDISQKDVLPDVKRIIAIGDLHGDLEQTIKCLKVGNLIEIKDNDVDTIKWIGGETVLVQVGDQIDRCRDLPCNKKMKNDENSDILILKLFTELHRQAIKVGGAVYSVIGNHELMNVTGRMEYVSRKNSLGFEKSKENEEFLKGKIPSSLKNMKARRWGFKPGNPIAEFLACTRKLALKVGKNLFVHAGILPEIAEKYPNISDMNKILSLYLFNELDKPEEYADILGSDVVKGKTYISTVDTREGPAWTRKYGNMTENKCDSTLNTVLKKYDVDRMIVGHTPQINKGINSKCNNSLWVIDYGASSAFDFVELSGKRSELRKAQVLEISDFGKTTKILTE